MAAARLEKALKKARALRDKGKLERALKHYRTACNEAESDPEPWRERGEVAHSLGERGEAVGALYRAAGVCERRGERGPSSQLAERVLELDPGHEGARELLARAGPHVAAKSPDDSAPHGVDAGGLASRAEGKEASSSAEDELGADDAARGEGAGEAAIRAEDPSQKGIEGDDSFGEGAEESAEADEGEGAGEGAGERAEESAEEGAREDAEEGAEESAGEGAREDAESEAAEGESESAEKGAREDAREPADLNASETEAGNGDAAARCGEPALSERPFARAGGEPAELSLEPPPCGGPTLRALTASIGGERDLCDLDGDLVARFIERGELIYRPAGRIVFGEGEIGESLFLLLQGQLVATRGAGPRESARRVATLRAGALFGEMAVLADAPRWATVTAERDATLIRVSRDAVRELLREEERLFAPLLRFYRARLLRPLMTASSLFAPLSAGECEELLSRFALREYPEGAPILRGGGAAGLYLVLAGELTCGPETGEGGRERGRLVPGDAFAEAGETAQRESSAVDVRAGSRAWILEFAGGAFRELEASSPRAAGRVAAELEALDGGGAEVRREGGPVSLPSIRPV